MGNTVRILCGLARRLDAG